MTRLSSFLLGAICGALAVWLAVAAWALWLWLTRADAGAWMVV